MIKIGSANAFSINNPAIFTGTAPNTVSQRTYTSGVASADISASLDNFTAVALDASSDTIALDKSSCADITFVINSNWFPASSFNGGQGAVVLSDNTAGNFTPVDLGA